MVGSFNTGVHTAGAILRIAYSWPGTAYAGQLNTMFDPTLVADKLTFETGETGKLVEFVPTIASAPIAILRYSVPFIGTCVRVAPSRQSVGVWNRGE